MRRSDLAVGRRLSPSRVLLAHAALILLSLVFLLPFFWLVSTSLKPDAKINDVTTADIAHEPIRYLIFQYMISDQCPLVSCVLL